MDWIILVHLLTESPTAMHAQSHYMAGFTSEKLCMDAVKQFRETFTATTETGTRISVRAACVSRKEAR